jgi:hypothetical protein
MKVNVAPGTSFNIAQKSRCVRANVYNIEKAMIAHISLHELNRCLIG